MRTLMIAAALAFAPAAHAEGLGDLSWLKGCWQLEQGDVSIVEVWSAPPAPVMYGYAITYRAGAPIFWEDTRIEDRDGALAFVGMPDGADPTRFPLLESGANRVVFENLDHDYPQRIVYERDGDNLVATTSAVGQQTDVFPYTRITCPAEFAP